MDKINAKIGTNYDLFNYYGAEDADRVIIAMGSICDVAEEVIDYLTAKARRSGLVLVRLYRPWVSEALLKVLPKTVKKIAVLDRTKEPGSLGEPLYWMSPPPCVSRPQRHRADRRPLRPGQQGHPRRAPCSLCTRNSRRDAPKARFTIGITDDRDQPEPARDQARAHHRGPPAPRSASSGVWAATAPSARTRTPPRSSADHTDKYIQAYFQYDSKKTGGVTISHLRFGDKPIRSPYYINQADFVACHNPAYIHMGMKMVQDVKPGGVFMINCQWTDEELDEHLNAADKKYIADNNIQLYTINAIDKAIEIGMGKRTNTILQSAFFKLADIMPIDEAVDYMKQAAKKSYGKKGDAVVEMNYKAIDAGVDAVHKVEVPASWSNPAPRRPRQGAQGPPTALVKMVRNVMEPVARMDGDSLPVSAFAHNANGEWGARRFRLREARHRRHGARMGCREVHPVQPVRVCLLSRDHPPVSA